MTTAEQSLFERTHTPNFLFLVCTWFVEDFAVESLRIRGYIDPRTPDFNGWLVRRQREALLDAYDRLTAEERRPRGRRRNSYVHTLILAAAAEAELAKGLGPVAADRAAAKRLGTPATKDKVQKARSEFAEIGARLFGYLPPVRAAERCRGLVAFVQEELDRHERELIAERAQFAADRRSRRIAGPIGGFFGAADSDRTALRRHGAK